MDTSSSLMGGPASADAPTNGEHRTGTTIVGICYDSGVVLAACSRTSTGMYVANRASDKISQRIDNVYVSRFGSPAREMDGDYVFGLLAGTVGLDFGMPGLNAGFFKTLCGAGGASAAGLTAMFGDRAAGMQPA
ncbi:hypothetical protein ZWY2020_049197 [Hordeum vulgare]|nr:hypothetical protein ZWY2020_049197 [Hordeum vulgare]